MRQVIEFRPARAACTPALYRCARCGTDLWNLYPDGRVRCADCEQECPLRTVHGNGTGQDDEMNLNEQANKRE